MGWRCTALWDGAMGEQAVSPDRAGTAALARSVSWGSRLCRAGRPPQVGTAPKYREPGPASLLPLKTVCAQLLAEWAGGRADECPHLLLLTSRRPAACSASPQLEAAKKAYHLACKEEKLAVTREMNSKTEQSVTPEQQKKLQDKVDKCKQDVQKVPAGLGAEGPWSGRGWQLRAWDSRSLCPGAYRRRRSMRRCWMKWARPPRSTWRAWSRCLNSASSLRKSGWSSSRRCCWTSNVTSTWPRAAGSWVGSTVAQAQPGEGRTGCEASRAPCCGDRKGRAELQGPGEKRLQAQRPPGALGAQETCGEWLRWDGKVCPLGMPTRRWLLGSLPDS